MKKSNITVQSLAIALLAVSIGQAHANSGNVKPKKSANHIRVPGVGSELKEKKSPNHLRALKPSGIKAKKSPKHIRK